MLLLLLRLLLLLLFSCNVHHVFTTIVSKKNSTRCDKVHYPNRPSDFKWIIQLDRKVMKYFNEHVAMLYECAVGRFNWANATFWLCGESGAADWWSGDDSTSAIGCWIGAKRRSRRSLSNSNNAAKLVCSCSLPLSYPNHFNSENVLFDLLIEFFKLLVVTFGWGSANSSTPSNGGYSGGHLPR